MVFNLLESSHVRPIGLDSRAVAFTEEDLAFIVSQFQVELPVTMDDFPQKGNINVHTYVLKGGDGQEYLLQKVNSDVFTRPYRVMDSMVACIKAQNAALHDNPQFWEPITLVPTRNHKPFLDISDEHGWCVWRLMEKIPGIVCYKSLSELDSGLQLNTAEEVGRGLALYGDLTSSMPAGLPSPLPGYRHTDIYYAQFDAVLDDVRSPLSAEPYLPKSEELRDATGVHFLVQISPEEARERRTRARVWIDKVNQYRKQAMVLHNALQDGTVRRMMIHGDTKIENFLFCAETGRVKSLIDLDTIVPGTWLADWGDMVRSLVNVAGECESDLSKVVVDEDVYAAVLTGFLKTSTLARPEELDLMVEAVISITLELGTRFLTDYLRGDSYFKISPETPNLNLIRGAVQLTLAEKLMAHAPKAHRLIAELVG
jgi:hypothetical protein